MSQQAHSIAWEIEGRKIPELSLLVYPVSSNTGERSRQKAQQDG